MLKLFYRARRLRHKKQNSVISVYTTLLSMILCMVCLTGTTWAWFTANEQVSVVTITAATWGIENIEVYRVEDLSTAVMTVSGGDAESALRTVSGGNAESVQAVPGAGTQSLWTVSGGDAASAQTVSGGDAEPVQAVFKEVTKAVWMVSDQDEQVGGTKVEVSVTPMEEGYEFTAEAGTQYLVEIQATGNSASGFLLIETETDSFYTTEAQANLYVQLTEQGTVQIRASWGTEFGDAECVESQ